MNSSLQYTAQPSSSIFPTPFYPKLCTTNIHSWILSILRKATALSVEQPIAYENFFADVEKARAVSALTSAVISSLPDETSTAIVTSDLPVSPNHIIAAMEALVLHTSHADHQTLKIHAENILFMRYEIIDDYFKAHETIWK